MRLSVFGLGYVGCLSAVCLAKDGHEVIGVDIDQSKVDMLNAGNSPVIEKDLGKMIKNLVAKRRLSATTDAYKGIM